MIDRLIDLLISTSGCKYAFQVAVFLQSVDEFLEFYGNLELRDIT